MTTTTETDDDPGLPRLHQGDARGDLGRDHQARVDRAVRLRRPRRVRPAARRRVPRAAPATRCRADGRARGGRRRRGDRGRSAAQAGPDLAHADGPGDRRRGLHAPDLRDRAEGDGGVTQAHRDPRARGRADARRAGRRRHEDQGAGGGWAWVLSDLKTLLETGEALPAEAQTSATTSRQSGSTASSRSTTSRRRSSPGSGTAAVSHVRGREVRAARASIEDPSESARHARRVPRATRKSVVMGVRYPREHASEPRTRRNSDSAGLARRVPVDSVRSPRDSGQKRVKPWGSGLLRPDERIRGTSGRAEEKTTWEGGSPNAKAPDWLASSSRSAHRWRCHPSRSRRSSRTGSRFQKVTLNDRPGEPMSLAVLPDGRVLHTARTGEIRIHNPKTGLNTMAADMREAPRGCTSTTRRASRASRSTRTSTSNRWVYVYYSPRLNTPTDLPGTGINEGDARRPQHAGGPGAARAVQGRYPALALQVRTAASSTSSTRAEDHRRAGRPRHLLPRRRQDRLRRRRATSTSRRATTRTRSSRRATRRSTSGRTATRRSTPSARPPTRTTCAARSCDPRQGGRRLRDPGGQPVPAGPGAARGPRSTPWASATRSASRSTRKSNNVYVGDYSPDAQTADPARGPAGHRPLDAHRPAGQLRLAVLHDAATIGYVDYDFATEESGEEFTACAGQRVAEQHGPPRSCPQVVQPDV